MTRASYTIGMDIGGTHTDAVLVDTQHTIRAAVKTSTTADISLGFHKALQQLLAQAAVDPAYIKTVYLGTTHATNAILQQRDLYKVGLIRIAGNDPDGIPPCYAWPQQLRSNLLAGAKTVNGGYECHGSPITSLNRAEIRTALQQLLDQGAESLAVVGVFSPLKHDQELEVEALAAEVCALPVSLSHRLGGVGYIDRENTTLLNAALKLVMAQGFQQMEAVMHQLELRCPLFITQNNGCVMDLAQAIAAPVLTISAGPTNSFIGASRLTGIQEAIIVDIGGTSTDVGLVRQGFPKRSLNTSKIGGVRLNFPMPDVLSIGIGGGSYVHTSASGTQIGPQSAGRRLTEEALCFGGNQLTLTDVAIAAGYLSIPGTDNSRISVSCSAAQAIMADAMARIDHEVTRMSGGRTDLPVLLVGGGAALLPKEQLDVRTSVPENANVANAFGAALGEVAGIVDTVVSLNKREETLEQLKCQAVDAALAKGAEAQSVRLIDLQIIPYHYMPENLARVTVVAAGRQQILS